MEDLPSASDLFIGFLRWLGTPAAFLLPLVLLLWVYDWIKTMADARKAATAARQLWSRVTIPAIVGYVLWQSVFVATWYSGIRLAGAMAIPNARGYTIADGRSFTWDELYGNIFRYSPLEAIQADIFYAALGWLLAFNLAQVLNSRLLGTVVMAPTYLFVGLKKGTSYRR